MFNLGMGEITVILLLALIFLGPKKLPDLASGLGRLIRELRKATSDVKNEIALDDTFRKPFEELRDAVTLHPDELKRRDQLKQTLENVRRQAEEVERAQQAQAQLGEEGQTSAPPPVTPAADAALAAVEPPSPDVPPPPVAAHAPVPPPVPEAHVPPPPAPHRAVPEAQPVAPGPAIPAGPPPGTVAAPPTRLGPPRVTPPISSLDADAANRTQTLSEEDLLPTVKPPALPPRKSTPPPLPGVAKPKKS